MLDYEIIALSSEMSLMDRETIKELDISLKDLMYNASKSFCTALLEDEIIKDVESILFLCGNGNNGGDGYAAALLLFEKGFNIEIYTVEPDKGRSKAAQYWFEKCFEAKKIKIIYDLDSAFAKADLIVDAMYGTGFRDEFNEQVGEVFRKVENISAKKVAIDAPSGVVMDNPRACKHAFKADLTITFEFLKYGLVSDFTAAYAGRVKLVSIGFPPSVREKMYQTGNRYILSDPLAEVKRKPDSHKGDYGKLLMICSSKNMTGAGYLSAMGALRTGIGLLCFSCPEDATFVMQAKLNEPIFSPYIPNSIDSFIENIGDLENYTSILHGCGVGNTNITNQINRYLLEVYDNTLVLDGDAINSLAADKDFINLINNKKCKLVLTPHPLEMARLVNKAVSYVQANRMSVAKDFAKNYDCAVILKGAKTIIALPEGKAYVSTAVNPGMARGGSGDILSGMVASLLAQNFPMGKALCSAVFRHAQSADKAKEIFGENAMLPSDMVNLIK